MHGNTLRKNWPIFALLLLIFLAFAEMTWLSIARYKGFNAGFDLAVMSQAIWSVTQGKLLLFSQESIIFSRLARHVELIYFPIAFFYAVRPSPTTLLIIQALLYAAGGWPVYRLALRHLHHPRPALVMVVIYLLYPVAQTSVLFDFHGDTLAMPFLLFMLESADRKAWRSYVFWLILALSCKMYVSIAVALMGGVLWLKGERKAGILTFIAAAVWGTLTFFVIRALFAPPEAEAVSATATSYASQYFGNMDLTSTGLERLFHALVVLVPILPLAFYEPLWLLPGLVLTGAILISTGNGPSYAYNTHHYSLAVPFFMMALIIAAGKRYQQQEQAVSPPRRVFPWRLQLLIALQLTILFNSAFVNTPLNIRFHATHQLEGRLPARYGITPRDKFLETWLHTYIPPDAALIIDGFPAAHLTNRSVLYLSDYDDAVRSFEQLLPEVDQVVFDLFPDPLWPEHLTRWQRQLAAVVADGQMRLIRSEAGLLLFARQGEPLPFALDTQATDPTQAVLASYDGQIGLLDMSVTPLGNQRWQLEYTWIRFDDTMAAIDGPPFLLALTTIEGWDRGRVAHPATLISPPTTWPVAVPMQETITIELPSDLPAGHYTLSVNWYNYQDLLNLVNETNSVDIPTVTLTLEIP